MDNKQMSRREFLKSGAMIGVGLGTATAILALDDSEIPAPLPDDIKAPVQRGEIEAELLPGDLMVRLDETWTITDWSWEADCPSSQCFRSMNGLPLQIVQCQPIETLRITAVRRIGENGQSTTRQHTG